MSERRVAVVGANSDRADIWAAALGAVVELGITRVCLEFERRAAGRSTAECAHDLSQDASLDLEDSNKKLTRVPYYRQHESKLQPKRKWR